MNGLIVQFSKKIIDFEVFVVLLLANILRVLECVYVYVPRECSINTPELFLRIH